MSSVLISIEFADSKALFAPTRPVTFGRGTMPVDIAIDEANPFLHRIAGRIAPAELGWELQNVGESTRLRLSTDLGAAFDLPPGASVRLLGPGGNIRFTAGKCQYEIRYRTAHDAELDRPELDGPKTSAKTDFLTPMQRQYLACYARIKIYEGRIPSRNEVATLMGDKATKTVDTHVAMAKDRAFEAGIAQRKVSVEELVRLLLAHNIFTPDELRPPRPM